MKKSILTEVHSNEARLLLYLADELHAPDRAQMDEALSRSPELQTMLADLRRLDERARRTLTLAGAEAPDVQRAISQTQAAMRRAAASPRASTTSAVEPIKLPLPWWMYPLAAAAAILIASAIFIANRSPRTISAPLAMPNGAFEAIHSDLAAEPELVSYDTYAMAEDLAASFDDVEHVLAGATTNELLSAARELDEIRASSRAFGDMVIQ